MQGEPKFDRSNKCIKCKVEKGNIVIRHAVYCKNCFFPLVTAKFRRCLDPYINEIPDAPRRKILRAPGNLLVGFSGGLGSTVLLDITSRIYFPSGDGSRDDKKGKAHPSKNRVWDKAYVCYVEVCNAFPEGQMKDRTVDIQKFFENNDHFELLPVRLEDAFDSRWWNKVGEWPSLSTRKADFSRDELPLFMEALQSNETRGNPVSLLRAYLSSLPTPTAVQSAISSFIRLILIHTANHLQCSHLLLGTSLTSLSVSLITAVAQGSGSQICEEFFEEWRSPPDMHEPDDRRNKSVKVVRPLRDIGMKECAAWSYWKNLSVVEREKLPGFSSVRTIGSLTKKFIVGLEKDYPSTVSTIVRTCAKLTPKEEAHEICVLCQRPTPLGVLDWKTRISVRSPPPENCSTSLTAVSEESRTQVRNQNDTPVLSNRLCYACHTHLTSKPTRSVVSGTSGVILPQWTNARLLASTASSGGNDEVWSTSAMSREQMKSVVGDFVLET
ncbi:uncharacterized protein FOMMEDRAFT_118050 [Fomitiporia mediterranea MF3/22]|uniref:uncharacterized protein n=1 Tax=Fomitiporia mediterranea (strain MF3/22) TaxID=694068 RepID=UPI00044091E2|nr:uncharacterized protein FOMMEDRAFT_118050 [Fomitiporia mediterranea MF3/22]EJD06980.1 hypothetical protein FOMMEDRAFT_118050 [Fomitiporia mediterranea MF3/22]